jgi:hypothetical protein
MNITDSHQEYELELKVLLARHRISFSADMDGADAFRGTAFGMGTSVPVRGSFSPDGHFSFPVDASLPVGTYHVQVEVDVDGQGRVSGTVGEPGKRPLPITGRRIR